MTLRVSSSKRDRRKTETSTFVNFIHQRDASIALSVVKKMLGVNAPIYTVHDNFITTSDYNSLIAEYYTQSIVEMGPPLYIINDFLIQNIIKPLFSKEKEEEVERKYDRCVIPPYELESYLKRHIPEKLTQKGQKTWSYRTNVIVECYKEYTRLVCLDKPGAACDWNSHMNMYDKFLGEIKKNLKNSRIVSY